FELGLDPDTSELKPGAAGQVAYWSVTDAPAAYARLLELGARKHVAVSEVGGGIQVGSVLDPDGNVFGIIHNPARLSS
ncbi:MAG TPA: VOC family protein, partial [Candidatus Dormibacteraeota bacterium]